MFTACPLDQAWHSWNTNPQHPPKIPNKRARRPADRKPPPRSVQLAQDTSEADLAEERGRSRFAPAPAPRQPKHKPTTPPLSTVELGILALLAVLLLFTAYLSAQIHKMARVLHHLPCQSRLRYHHF